MFSRQPPPQPPARPDKWHWLYGVSADRADELDRYSPAQLQFLYDLSEEERCEYDLALVRYLHGLHDDRWMMTINDMAVYYRALAYEGTLDPVWKRGGER